MGKQAISPLGGLPNMKAIPWLRDLFPDLLWVCFHLSQDIDDGLRAVVATLDFVNETLDEALNSLPSARPTFDGSLFSWSAIPEEARGTVLAKLAERSVYELAFPEDFAHVLGMYPEAPGHWIIGPWREKELHIDPERAERALSDTIVASAHGHTPVATRAKAIALRGLIVAQRIHFPPDSSFELLPKWPNNVTEEERRIIEAAIRAAFGAFSEMFGFKNRIEWARSFWRANWRLFPCRIVAGDHAAEVQTSEILEEVRQLADRVDDLWQRFEEACRKTDPDLYDPDRHEVLSGIVARCLRILTAACHTPTTWTAEHSPPLMRSLVESLIVLSWLALRNDREMFTGFKDYGRGRLKLVKLHWEEFADSLESVPDEVQAMIDELDNLVNQDIWEEYQNIDLSGSFAKVDTRKMAEEARLLREYRLVFAPSSSEAHGEWGHLDRYALTRCMTIPHRFHRIPSDEVVPAIEPRVVRGMVELGERVVEVYCSAIREIPPDPEVDDARWPPS